MGERIYAAAYVDMLKLAIHQSIALRVPASGTSITCSAMSALLEQLKLIFALHRKSRMGKLSCTESAVIIVYYVECCLLNNFKDIAYEGALTFRRAEERSH